MRKRLAISLGTVLGILAGLIPCDVSADQTTHRAMVERDWLKQAKVATLAALKPQESALPGGKILYPIQRTIDRGRLLATDLQEVGVETQPYEREFDETEALAKTLEVDAPDSVRRDLYFQARRTVRHLAFANPLLDFKELVLVKRFTQETYPDVCLNHMPWVSRPGGDICIVTLHGPDGEPAARNLLNGALGPGHVHGMDLWWDADRAVFGYAKAKSDKPPQGWKDRRTNYRLRRTEEPIHLFEIGLDDQGLRQLTDGEWSDLDPTYAPNGDIVFASERCECSLQCNELDKDETSCNLFVCRPDGSNIRHMSASKDGDYLPHTLSDGTIGYTRWEYQERGWAHIQSVWFIRPDGTGADALFKQHLNDPWALEDMRSIPGTGENKLVAIATGHHTLAAGPIVVITPSQGMNDSQAIRIVTPGVLPPEGGMSGTPVEPGGVLDRGGFYMTPWPLSEKYFLASHTYSHEQTDPTGYAIYLVDVFGTKELIYRDPDISSFVPIPLEPRVRPPILADVTNAKIEYATCVIGDIGRGVTGVSPQAIRFLRIAHRLQWPYDNQHGGQRYAEKAWPHNWTPARVIGTVPIEADGSACFQVPANTPLYFQLLDENHMELRRMRSFISFQPGEVRGCVGCHETRAEVGASRRAPIAARRSPSIPVPPPWGTQAISFLRDIQPVFDRHCTECHGGLSPAAELDFSKGLTAQHNRAYDTILTRELVSWSDVNEDAKITAPLAFGSHRSKLVEVLRNTPHRERAKLSEEDWLRLVTWIDANAPYHGGFINKRPEHPAYDLPADTELTTRIASVHARRCSPCHKPEAITRADWIDLDRPQQSLFLTAPLSEPAGNGQRCTGAVYRDTSDSDYRMLLQTVENAVKKARSFPRRDVKFLAETPSSRDLLGMKPPGMKP